MHSQRKPKLGQNFLVDDVARQRIADALGDVSERTVIEIGPGHGAITSILAERAKRLVCVELDRSLAPELRFKFRNHPNVEVVEADILTTDLAVLANGEKADVVGNLPYYITSDILLHLYSFAGSLRSAVVMMQREVADRVSAEPGVRDFGLLSATAQLYGTVENLFTLPPSAFSPPPEVYSSVLRIHFAPRLAELGISDSAAFTRFLRQGFQQKRKTLANNLRGAGFTNEQIALAEIAAAVPPQSRAEALSVDQLAAIFRSLTS